MHNSNECCDLASYRLVINESLYVGSQLPYITRAMRDGFGVIVLNTNHHKVNMKDGKQETVKFGCFVSRNSCSSLPNLGSCAGFS